MSDDNLRKGPDRYGAMCWKVILADSGTVFLMADSAEVAAGGALVFWGGFRMKTEDPKPGPEDRIVVFGLSAGSWAHFYAASAIDGGAVAVDWWEGPDPSPPAKSSYGRRPRKPKARAKAL